MADWDEMLGVILIGIAIFIVLVVVIVFGEISGGSWQLVSQGVTKFIVVITIFGYAVYALVKVLGRR